MPTRLVSLISVYNVTRPDNSITELWAWAQPSGYCVNGACVASLTTVGDPAY